jgi:hypothetical protein
MAGMKNQKDFRTSDRIDLSERKAMEYWAKRWGVTTDQITSAQRKVGHLVKDIASELGKKR